MKKTGRTAVACLALLLSSGTIISGHHSQAVFDLDNQITLEGKIVQVNWGNPHSLFFLEGKKVGEPDSQIKRWAMEGPSPLSLTRDRKSTRLNSSHVEISYAVFCLKKKKTI